MKRTFLILFCSVAIAVVISTCVPAQTKLPPPITFSAGDSVILHRLTYGTNHLVRTGQGWLRPLPSSVRSKLSHLLYGTKPVFRDLVTPEPSLVLWIENTRCNPPSGPTGHTWLMLADESGHAAGSRTVYSERYRASKGTVAFTGWPRSSQKLTIRWFEGTLSEQGKLLGEWVVPNPAYQPPTPWVAESLPLARTNGPLRCTL